MNILNFNNNENNENINKYPQNEYPQNEYPQNEYPQNDYYNNNYYNHSNYIIDDGNFFYINSLFGIFLLLFLFSSCYKSIRNSSVNNERNQRLLRNEIPSEDNSNSENIEKIEIKFTNELYDKECTIWRSDEVVQERTSIHNGCVGAKV